MVTLKGGESTHSPPNFGRDSTKPPIYDRLRICGQWTGILSISEIEWATQFPRLPAASSGQKKKVSQSNYTNVGVFLLFWMGAVPVDGVFDGGSAL